MKKLLFVVLALFAFVAYADNTITSKEYVDGQVSNLQTQIPAKNTNTVLTNTGTAGTVGDKVIYDTTAAYGAQSDALVTAAAFNSAVQNALESEFVCVEWLGDVHDNAHCLLYEVRGATANQSPNLLCEPSALTLSAFDVQTGIFTNTSVDTRSYVQLFIFVGESLYKGYDLTRPNQIARETFTTLDNTNILYLKHNGAVRDFRIYFPVEPSTTYTLLVKAIETNPTVVGGIKLQLMLVRGEYDSDVFIPCGNVYLPSGN